jgi:hypothetical protein
MIFQFPTLALDYSKTHPCWALGEPSFLNPSFLAQVCVVSSKGIDIENKTPIIESPPHIKVPPVEEIIPQEFLESVTAPLITYPPPPPL